ncbi:MAG TPA: flagellar basal-body rod protein FlgG [Bacteroidota bacterium]|nr:flagellar basal-body rod protein FlgG [Bacteroidota bacterium]
MNRALRTAATGMAAQQLTVDVISHNIANVNTTGFKKSRPEFQDLMYQVIKASGDSQDPNQRPPSAVQVGNGAIPVSTAKNFAQGDIQPTNNPLDLAIQGDGFFQIRRTDGTIAYTRDGTLKMSADGTLVTAQGFPIEPAITFPSDAASITVSRDGEIDALVPGDAQPSKIGQLELAKFVNPAGLQPIGDNLYIETPSSGQPMTGTSATSGFGEINQGALESSNVDIVDEMVNMIVAQRAYEINSKTIKTVDDMLTMTNNLKS